MGKLFLAASLILLGGMTDNNHAISIDPDPPKAGKSATITYRAGASLIIEYTPGGVVRVTCGADGKADVVVAAGANAMLITDASNSQVSAGFSVTP